MLIPRPETEQLLDLAGAALAAQPQLADRPWADLGTGSGAIALGLASLLPASAQVRYTCPIYLVPCTVAATVKSAAPAQTRRAQFSQLDLCSHKLLAQGSCQMSWHLLWTSGTHESLAILGTRPT